MSLFCKLRLRACVSPLAWVFRAGLVMTLVVPARHPGQPSEKDGRRWTQLSPPCSCHSPCSQHPELPLRCMGHTDARGSFLPGSARLGSASSGQEGAGLSPLEPCPRFLSESPWYLR